jgi:hypothetical protein
MTWGIDMRFLLKLQGGLGEERAHRWQLRGKRSARQIAVFLTDWGVDTEGCATVEEAGPRGVEGGSTRNRGKEGEDGDIAKKSVNRPQLLRPIGNGPIDEYLIIALINSDQA